MSGIFGAVRFNGVSVDRANLEPMARALSHRGPDGIEFHVEPNVALGQCLLHTTRESLNETLPFHHAASGTTIVADARIDNRKTLIKRLDLRPDPDEPVPDSQLILAAYDRWGPACVDHLLGDFAFAIWDEPRQCLFLARDHVGMKPVYYSIRGDFLLFASSADAVAASPYAQFSLNETHIADALMDFADSMDETSTWYEGILRLPPGSTLTFDRTGGRIERYWRPTVGTPLRLSTDEEYLDALTELLDEALAARMRSHKAVGLMLSGGVDSGTLLGHARKPHTSADVPEVRTYSGIDPDNPECLETRFIRQLTENTSTATYITPDEAYALGSTIDQWYATLEDPGDACMMIPSLVYHRSAKDGLRVVIDGFDGDVVAAQISPHLPWMIRAGQITEAWREARGIAENDPDRSASHYRLLLSAARSAAVPQALRDLRKRLSAGRRFRQRLAESWISPAFSKTIDLRSRMARYENNEPLLSCGPHAELHQRWLQAPFVSAGAARYERTAAAWGIEARHPFFDVRIVEFFLNLPWHMKTRRGWPKYLLRSAAARVISPDIAWQSGRRHLGGLFHEAYLEYWRAKKGNSWSQESSADKADWRVLRPSLEKPASLSVAMLQRQNLLKWTRCRERE